MSILGTGIDVAEVARVAVMIERWGPRFTHRAFTEAEANYCLPKRRAAECFAARWAAKEATYKALGGPRGTKIWRLYEVIRAPSGKPTMRLHGRAAEAAERLGVRHIHVSLTHDADLAAAVVVLEG